MWIGWIARTRPPGAPTLLSFLTEDNKENKDCVFVATFVSFWLVRVPFFATSTVQRFPNFPRNLAPDFTHYLSERPEMIFSQGEVTDGQKQEKEIRKKNDHENKIS